MKWVERTWSFDLPVGAFPGVLERLRGTPARAAELVAGVPEEILSARPGTSWSAKDHIGHLDDLHDLDVRRAREFQSCAPMLSAADMSNRKTEEGNHRAAPSAEILTRLRAHRAELVDLLESLPDDAVSAACIHPRLRRSVRLIDWAQFVAEHDDHHLARSREALRDLEARG